MNPSELPPKQQQRYITERAKEMHLNGKTTEDIAKVLGKDEECIIWVLQK